MSWRKLVDAISMAFINSSISVLGRTLLTLLYTAPLLAYLIQRKIL
ncbi:hypothetical protein IPA_03280 [Ignicoccus pacificus DSM 13166]|uniref:Uncharacterized protein n=1 Tax=Ignicoccus pacificus DSM 13166 TaxID=940294 RepID=A0A977KCP1_9CREN|nr:hypothetical protein IPA_03280 [Ignicoccus pacificus DSM 13166]